MASQSRNLQYVDLRAEIYNMWNETKVHGRKKLFAKYQRCDDAVQSLQISLHS